MATIGRPVAFADSGDAFVIVPWMNLGKWERRIERLAGLTRIGRQRRGFLGLSAYVDREWNRTVKRDPKERVR